MGEKNKEQETVAVPVEDLKKIVSLLSVSIFNVTDTRFLSSDERAAICSANIAYGRLKEYLPKEKS